MDRNTEFNQRLSFQDEYNNMYDDDFGENDDDTMELENIVLAETPQQRGSTILGGNSTHEVGLYIGEDSSRLSFMEDGGDHIFDDDDTSNHYSHYGGRVYETGLNDVTDSDYLALNRNRYGSAGSRLAAATTTTVGEVNFRSNASGRNSISLPMTLPCLKTPYNRPRAKHL